VRVAFAAREELTGPVRSHAGAASLVVAARSAPLRRAELAWGGLVAAEWGHFVALGVFAYRVGGTSAVGIAGVARMLPAAVLAPFASSPSRIRGIAHTRRQETDRVAAVARELKRLGARVDESAGELEIAPSAMHGGIVETYGDHRMAMSFALIGLKVPGIRILDPRCVDKTFPEFFERLESLRAPA